MRQEFDRIVRDLHGSGGQEVVGELIASIDEVRRSMSPESWRSFIGEVVRPHPIARLMLEDPYTKRAYTKPRGYAGDAPLLDYVYDGVLPNYLHPPDVSDIGRRIFSATTGSKSADAVRDRCRRIASLVDTIAARKSKPVVVSLACGHAREVDLSAAVAKGEISTWHCLDQDPESIQFLAERRTAPPLVPAKSSVKAIVSGSETLPRAEFIYAAGLFDYLQDNIASALLQRMLAAVSDGGQVLISNFAHDSTERGYMEAFMDWWLIYRSEGDLSRLVASLQEGPSISKTYRDNTGRVIYLELHR